MKTNSRPLIVTVEFNYMCKNNKHREIIYYKEMLDLLKFMMFYFCRRLDIIMYAIGKLS